MPSVARRFELVPFGGRAPENSVACDGLVSGAALDLSHWSNNKTPERYKRDTSTESALVYAAASDVDSALDVVANNHFDLDGLLSVFALLQPEIALRHRDVMIAAAEVGDFDEWPNEERGLWLDAAISHINRLPSGDRASYRKTLDALPDLLEHLSERRDLWGEGIEALERDLARAQSGDVEVAFDAGIAMFVHREGIAELPGPVLHRIGPKNAKRWLMAFDRGGGRWDYRYERPRHAWADTVARPQIKAPSRNRSSAELGPGWALKGDLGMTGICRTSKPSPLPPREVLSRIARSDPGLRS